MRNGLTTLVDNEARMVEAFAMDRWRLDSDLILIAAAQAVWADRAVRNTNANSGSVANPRDSYSRINPSLGIIYRAREDVDLYANVSRLFEAPTNFELEDNVAGSSATLRAMKGTVVEFGTRGSGRLGRDSRWSWDLSYYFAKVRDEILSVEDPNAPGTSLVTNVDATVHSGIETILSARFELAGNRSIEPVLSVTLNDFTFDDDAAYENNSLPAAPNHVVRGEIIYRGGRGLFAGPSFEFVGDRYADFVNSYKISSYLLLGFRAGWSNDTWTVFSELRNLTDEAYVANHSVRNNASVGDAILNPGEPRSVYFGIQRQFD
jgi:iron complex outermembrane receptor protein